MHKHKHREHKFKTHREHKFKHTEMEHMFMLQIQNTSLSRKYIEHKFKSHREHEIKCTHRNIEHKFKPQTYRRQV